MIDVVLFSGLVAQQGGGGSAPTLAQIQATFSGGKQGVIYDYHDPGSVFQERTGAGATTPSVDLGPIGSLKDLSPNSNWATCNADAARPTWNSAGYGLGDGVNDFLQALFTISQPIVRVSCYRGLATNLFDGSFNRLLAGANGGNATLLATGAVNRHGIFSGTAGPDTVVAINTDMVITERYSGVTSRIARDGDIYATSNAGTTVPGGTTMFANENVPPSQFANMRLYREVIIGDDPSDATISMYRQWVSEFADVNVFSPVTKTWIAEGDSLTAKAVDRITYWYRFFDGNAQSNGFNGQNFAAGGSTLATVNARLATTQAAIAAQVANGKSVVASVLIGANPVAGSIPTIAELQTLWAALRSSGAEVVACTLTPQTVVVNPTFNTQRNILNPQIRAATSDWDGLADFAANSLIGPDAAASDTNYYSDGLHLTDLGQTVMQSIIQPVVTGLA